MTTTTAAPVAPAAEDFAFVEENTDLDALKAVVVDQSGRERRSQRLALELFGVAWQPGPEVELTCGQQSALGDK